MEPTDDGAVIVATARPWTDGRARAVLFGDERTPGVSFSQKRLLELSPLYSRLYLDILAAVSPVLADAFGVPVAAADIPAREAAASLVHFFMDRLLRVDALLQSRPAARFSVLGAPEPGRPADIVHFRVQAQYEPEFNEAMLCRLAGVFGLPVVAPAPPPSAGASAEPEPARAFVNYNFTASRLSQKVLRRLLGGWAVLKRTIMPGTGGSIPILSMAYATNAFKEAGFLVSRLTDVRGRAALVDAPRDEALRRRLAEAVAGAAGAVNEFVEKAGVRSPAARAAAVPALSAFLAEYWPTNLLEAVGANVAACRDVLRRFAPAPLLTGDTGSQESTYMLSAAKTLGMRTIGCQHGGHYGYIEDHAQLTDLEYSYFDLFITWGWKTMPDWDVCRDVRTFPLPHPWLSERREAWTSALPPDERFAARKFDLLLMTNKVYPFPPAPSGASVCRGERAGEFGAHLVELVRRVAAADLRIFHKPFNARTERFFRRTFAEMARAGGERYEQSATFDKGLNPDLLRRCAIVLWDQPGTGFLECLVSGLPTMAYWPRIYNHEFPSAAAAIGELEAAGLIHREPESLVAAVKAFKASPREWMENAGRRRAIASFCKTYAWEDARWRDHWEAFLDGLKTAAD